MIHTLCFGYCTFYHPGILCIQKLCIPCTVNILRRKELYIYVILNMLYARNMQPQCTETAQNSHEQWNTNKQPVFLYLHVIQLVYSERWENAHDLWVHWCWSRLMYQRFRKQDRQSLTASTPNKTLRTLTMLSDQPEHGKNNRIKCLLCSRSNQLLTVSVQLWKKLDKL